MNVIPWKQWNNCYQQILQNLSKGSQNVSVTWKTNNPPKTWDKTYIYTQFDLNSHIPLKISTLFFLWLFLQKQQKIISIFKSDFAIIDFFSNGKHLYLKKKKNHNAEEDLGLFCQGFPLFPYQTYNVWFICSPQRPSI